MAFEIRQLRARQPFDDAGTSLMELIVGMAIMSIFMAMFTGAVISMTRTSNKVEAVTISSSQVSQVFLRLDKSIRYATAISTSGQSSSVPSDWYIEYASVDATAAVDETCTQLRIDTATAQLQQRVWTVTDSNPSTPPDWTTLASPVVNGAATAGSTVQPFVVPLPVTGVTSSFQQLTVTLVVNSGSPSVSTTQSSMSFTALNSDATVDNTATCHETGWAGRP